MTPGLAVLFLLLHLLVCVGFYFLLRFRILEADVMLLPICVFVPVFGPVLTLLVSWVNVNGLTGSKNRNLEAMRKDLVSEKSTPDVDQESGEALPLQDALILNDAGVRRNAMLEILLHGASDMSYVLHQAKDNADVEVVHYATTALSELLKNYDLRLQKLSKAHEEHPEDAEVLADYIDTLDEYLRNALAEGENLRIQRTRYVTLLKERIQKEMRIEDVRALIRSLMYSKNYDQAEQWLVQMETRWPEREETMMLRLRYYYELHMGAAFTAYIEKLKTSGCYLSGRLRRVIQFWEET